MQMGFSDIHTAWKTSVLHRKPGLKQLVWLRKLLTSVMRSLGASEIRATQDYGPSMDVKAVK